MIMNILEQKCNILKQTPQSRWFDLRYKAVIMQLQNMAVKALPLNVIFPLAGNLNMQGHFFQYDSEFYFLFVAKQGNVIDCFHLERSNSEFQNMLTAHIVLSSDDNPNEQSFLPMFCAVSGITNTKDLIYKCQKLFR